MKKSYFITVIMLMVIFFSGNSYSQFQGLIEMKETTYGSPIQKQKNLNDMIPPEAKAEIQKQIKEKEDELKSKSKSDEDYESLANEIKMMKEQIGSLSGETSAEQPKIEFIKMYFMGDNVRTETVIDGKPSGSAIIKVKEKKMVIIMDEEKKYMEMDFEMLKQMAAAFKKMKPTDQKKDEEPQPKSNVKKTGNHMDILGYKCDEYIMESEETNSTAWICPNFTNFWKIFAEMGKSFEMDKQKGPNDWFSNVLGESGFPFKAIEKNKDGKSLSEWEITNIDKTKPDASLFAPPKGYTKMDMNNMFNAK